MRSVGTGSLFGGAKDVSAPARSKQVGLVKDTVRATLGLPEEATVVVQELACAEPGCPPVETVIAVLGVGGTNRRWTLHGPISEVTESQVRSLLTRPSASSQD